MKAYVPITFKCLICRIDKKIQFFLIMDVYLAVQWLVVRAYFQASWV